MDKRAANYVGLENIHFSHVHTGLISFVEILHLNYSNNLIDEVHRFIKKITNPMILEKPSRPQKTQKALKFSKRYQIVGNHPKGE